MTELRTRPPTGQVAYPLILVEGEEKAGKSVAAYTLSASPKIGRTFVFDLGEGTADEYAELGPYEVVEHNGTYADLLEQVRAACAIPSDPAAPNVIVLDDGTALWDLLKDWTNHRARNSQAGRKKLKADPDAEVDASMNLWNDAKDRWHRILNTLRAWPGIAVIIARGKEVSKVQGGVPVAGETEWKVETEKTTAFAVSAWVRMTRPHTATLVGARSLHVDIPRQGLKLPETNPLEHLVFEILGAGGDFGTSNRVVPSIGIDRVTAKTHLLEILKDGGLDEDRAKTVAGELWPSTNPAELTEDQWAELDQAARAKLAALNAEHEATVRDEPVDEFEPGDATADEPIDPTDPPAGTPAAERAAARKAKAKEVLEQTRAGLHHDEEPVS